MIVGTTQLPSNSEIIFWIVLIMVLHVRNRRNDDDPASVDSTGAFVTLDQYRDILERIVYENIYLPNRSLISLSTQFAVSFWYHVCDFFPIKKTTTIKSITTTQPFTCDICMFRLGGQDSDTDRFQYGCTCTTTTPILPNTPCNQNNNDSMMICKHCTRTDIVYQITNQNKSVPLCVQRKCYMDDRYVRKRIHELFCTRKRISIIQLLDRNQIEEACNSGADTANTSDNHVTISSFHNRINKNNRGSASRTERFWRCPTPDCKFAAFVPDATHYIVPLQKQQYNPLVLLSSMTNYMSRFITNSVSSYSYVSSSSSNQSTTTTPTTNHCTTNVDPRKVTCPVCKVCSCQLCSMIWSIGIVQHDRVHCTEHERTLTQTVGSIYPTTTNDTNNTTGSRKNGYNSKLTKNTTNTMLYYGLQQWKQNKMKHDLIRDCPSCKIVIEKNAGCKHMTCTMCKYEFCWICNQKWSIGHMNVNCSSLS